MVLTGCRRQPREELVHGNPGGVAPIPRQSGRDREPLRDSSDETAPPVVGPCGNAVNPQVVGEEIIVLHTLRRLRLARSVAPNPMQPVKARILAITRGKIASKGYSPNPSALSASRMASPLWER